MWAELCEAQSPRDDGFIAPVGWEGGVRKWRRRDQSADVKLKT